MKRTMKKKKGEKGLKTVSRLPMSKINNNIETVNLNNGLPELFIVCFDKTPDKCLIVIRKMNAPK